MKVLDRSLSRLLLLFALLRHFTLPFQPLLPRLCAFCFRLQSALAEADRDGLASGSGDENDASAPAFLSQRQMQLSLSDVVGVVRFAQHDGCPPGAQLRREFSNRWDRKANGVQTPTRRENTASAQRQGHR